MNDRERGERREGLRRERDGDGRDGERERRWRVVGRGV